MRRLVPTAHCAQPAFTLRLVQFLALLGRHRIHDVYRLRECVEKPRISAYLGRLAHARFVALFAALVMLSACSTTSGSFCAIAKPIRPDNVDALSDREVAELLAHNEKGARLCGWKK